MVSSYIIKGVISTPSCYDHALGGFDYTSGPYIVKISTGKNTASFRIAITNDNKRENNETFYLAVDSSSLPNGVVVGSPGQAKVTIVDKTSSKLIF